jgi:hypothetical protein
MARFEDLKGRRYGRLTVLRRTDDYVSPSGKHTVVWHCQCDCGQEVDVLRNQLTSGQTNSCGCLQRERAENAAMDLTGRRFGRLTVIRRVDAVKQYSNGLRHAWLCRCGCGAERIYTQKELMHSNIQSCGCMLRERSRDRVDQRGENMFGHVDGTALSAIRKSRKANKNSKTGVLGVYYSARDGKYIAKIGLRGKTITIGRFDSLDDAAAARRRAEEEYYDPVLEKYQR